MEKSIHQNPRKHYRYRFTGLRYPRQRETVASDPVFPTAKSSCGHTCSRLFLGTMADRCNAHPLEKESLNGADLQY